MSLSTPLQYQLLGDADVVVKHLARYLQWDIGGGKQSASANQKRKHSNSKYKVIGNRLVVELLYCAYPARVTHVRFWVLSGVILFKGAEGGRYVDELIASRKGKDPSAPDGVGEAYLTESDVSESEDGGRKSMNGDGEGQARKRPRRSLTQKPSDFRTGW